MKFVTVDMQGFNIPEFFPKELVIYDGRRTSHFIVRSPVPLLSIEDPAIIRQIKYCQRYVHGLHFEAAGDVDYEDVGSILRSHLQNVDVVYVKGSAKKNYLLKVFNGLDIDILNLEQTPGCPKFEKQMPACPHHAIVSEDGTTRCAVNNCQLLYTWLLSLLPML